MIYLSHKDTKTSHLKGEINMSKKQIKKIIEEKYKNFDKSKINIKDNRILSRITYIVMPIWKLDEFAKSFQNLIF